MSSWTNKQSEYLRAKGKRYKTPDGDHNYQSILDYEELQDIADLYSLFIMNIFAMAKIYKTGYIGKDFYNIHAESEENKKVWDGGLIDKDTLKHLIKKHGVYLPAMLINKEDNLILIECLFSQHPSSIMKKLFKDGEVDGREIFYITKDMSSDPIDISLDLPIALYEDLVSHLGLEVIAKDSKKVTLRARDKSDAWLLMKLIQKEVSCLILRKWQELISNGFFPDSRINRGLRDEL